jgi:hypothetical protein
MFQRDENFRLKLKCKQKERDDKKEEKEETHRKEKGNKEHS